MQIATHDTNLFPADATLHMVRVDGSVTSGIAVFGSSLHASGIAVDVESKADRDNGLGDTPHDFTLTDLGENACGCGASLGQCKASSAELQPIPTP